MNRQGVLWDTSKQQNSDTESDLDSPQNEEAFGFRVQYDGDYFVFREASSWPFSIEIRNSLF